MCVALLFLKSIAILTLLGYYYYFYYSLIVENLIIYLILTFLFFTLEISFIICVYSDEILFVLVTAGDNYDPSILSFIFMFNNYLCVAFNVKEA